MEPSQKNRVSDVTRVFLLSLFKNFLKGIRIGKIENVLNYVFSTA